jgi:hypothetical protein
MHIDIVRAGTSLWLDFEYGVFGAEGEVTYFDGEVNKTIASQSHNLYLDLPESTEVYGMYFTVTSETRIRVGTELDFNLRSVSAVPEPLWSDFDGDLDVDDSDLAIWESSFDEDHLAAANFDWATTGADFLIWQQQFGRTLVPQFI